MGCWSSSEADVTSMPWGHREWPCWLLSGFPLSQEKDCPPASERKERPMACGPQHHSHCKRQSQALPALAPSSVCPLVPLEGSSLHLCSGSHSPSPGTWDKAAAVPLMALGVTKAESQLPICGVEPPPCLPPGPTEALPRAGHCPRRWASPVNKQVASSGTQNPQTREPGVCRVMGARRATGQPQAREVLPGETARARDLGEVWEGEVLCVTEGTVQGEGTAGRCVLLPASVCPGPRTAVPRHRAVLPARWSGPSPV